MPHVMIIRIPHSPDPEDYNRWKGVADSIGQVKGVVSSKLFMHAEHLIHFTEVENWATLDKIQHDSGTKAARRALKQPLSAGFSQEFWSGNSPSSILEVILPPVP